MQLSQDVRWTGESCRRVLVILLGGLTQGLSDGVTLHSTGIPNGIVVRSFVAFTTKGLA